MDKAVAECLAGGRATGAEIWATTVGTSGLVDATGRVVLSVALPEWTGVHLAEHVSRLVARPVLVENDSRLAALAETWRGCRPVRPARGLPAGRACAPAPA